jgi:phage terminase large subunit
MARDNEFIFNRVFAPVFSTNARYIHIWGGRAAGRSHFATDYALFLITQPAYFRGAFLRHVFGDIRESLFQDFKDRIEASSFDEADFDINESKLSIVYRPTGNSIISKGFKKSAGNRSAKLKSLAGLTHVFIEEADENEEDDVNKLDDSIRTNKIENIQVIFLYNPPSKNHWIIKRFFRLIDCGLRLPDGKPAPYYRAVPIASPDVLAIHTTYLDNIENLNEKTVAKYNAYGTPGHQFYNQEYYYRDVLGLVSEGARGRIYRDWKPVTNAFFESLPYPSYYGLDFGYSSDPVAMVEIKSHNNRNFFRELIYEPGLTNPQLARLMVSRGVKRKAPIYADSAEPKSIQELRDLGFNVLEADKGPDSVLYGIKMVASMENFITEGSANLWAENEEYRWALDANKEPTDTPEDKNNHLKDGLRYGVTTHKKRKRARNIKIASPTAGEPARNTGKRNPLDWI